MVHFVNGKPVDEPPQGIEAFERQREIDARPVPPTVAQTKAEAARRIEAILPDYKQRNALALALETTQEHGADPSKWPADLKAENTAYMTQWKKIKRIRKRSDEIELQIKAGTFTGSLTDDGVWND